MSAQEIRKGKFEIQCLTKINDTDASIRTLTFDGNAANVSMARFLGANLSAFS